MRLINYSAVTNLRQVLTPNDDVFVVLRYVLILLQLSLVFRSTASDIIFFVFTRSFSLILYVLVNRN